MRREEGSAVFTSGWVSEGRMPEMLGGDDRGTVQFMSWFRALQLGPEKDVAGLPPIDYSPFPSHRNGLITDLPRLLVGSFPIFNQAN